MQNDKEKFKIEFTNRLIKFSVQVVRFCSSLSSEKTLWPLVDQLIRSACSVGANVVEAKSSSSRRDYIHFFEISLKSANETKYWLLVIKETSPQFVTQLDLLYREADEISRVLGSSVLTLKGKK